MKASVIGFLMLVSSVAYAQFNPNKKVYSVSEGYWDYWDEIFAFKFVLDTAYYDNGNIVYRTAQTEAGGEIVKLYPNGEVHMNGRNIEVKRHRLLPMSGNWTVFRPSGALFEEFGFRNARKYGESVSYTEDGKIIDRKVYNQRFTVGFSMGIFPSSLKVRHDGTSQLEVISGQGFDIGFHLAYKINKKLDIRTLMTESFLEYVLVVDGGKLPLGYLYTRVPVTVQYYVLPAVPLLFGLNNGFKINDESDLEFDRDVFSIRNYDLSIEAGVSYQIKLKRIVLAPEIRYSQSLNNLAKDSEAKYSTTIQNMKRNELTFSIVVREQR